MSDEKEISDQEKLAQMLERLMRVAEMLVHRSQFESDKTSTADEKTQQPRSAVQ